MLQRKWLRLRYSFDRMVAGKAPRIAYLHIPKCGGTTIFHHFKSNLGNSKSGKAVHFDSEAFARFDDAALETARRAQFVSGHFGWNALCAVGAGAIQFTTLRDPFKRLRSLYSFSRSKAHSAKPLFAATFEAAKQRSFGDFCLSPEPEVRMMIDNAMTRTLADDYACDKAWDHDTTLRAAMRNLDRLDLVIDLDDLNAEMPRICQISRTRLVRGQPNQNVTPPSDLRLMSRDEFESDVWLHKLIAQDEKLYHHAFGPRRSRGEPADINEPEMTNDVRRFGS